ncbi:MAG: hypothetical protein ACYTGP_00875 [Planctomycetota bacterium]|jgi:hypothetical protein
MRSRHGIVVLAATFITLGSGVAHAQGQGQGQERPPATPPPPPPPTSELHVTLRGGGEYQFESTLDNGGEVTVGRIGGGLAISTQLTTDLSMRLGFGYEMHAYDFKGGVGFAGLQLWDDIHFLRMGAQFTYTLDEDWSLFGGPIAMSSREDDGDWDDSWTAGGIAGAMLRVDEGLTIGLGIGVTSQLQDSARWFPAVIIEAELSSNWRLTTRGNAGITSDAGLEAVYDLGDDWEFGVGGTYNFRRFRLDNTGSAPNGVGQEEGFVFYLRLGWDPSPDVSITGRVGMTLGAEFEGEMSNGIIFAESDYDPAAVLGIVGTLRF